MRKLFFLAAALILASTSAAPAWAWGCSGHEIVALIAHQELEKLDAQHRTRSCPRWSGCWPSRIATTRTATAAT